MQPRHPAAGGAQPQGALPEAGGDGAGGDAPQGVPLSRGRLAQEGGEVPVGLVGPPRGGDDQGRIPPEVGEGDDPGVGPDGPLRLRAPLTATFNADGVDDPTPYELVFDEGVGAYVFDYAATGLGTSSVEMVLQLKDDLEPSPLKTSVEVL